MSPVMLEVTGLTIAFGGLTAVSSMTFNVREGEVLSLIGPNGAGKTSAFNAITGYLRPVKGSVVFLGRSINGVRPDRIAARGLVRTFQKTSVFATQSAHSNVLTGLHLSSRQRLLPILLGSRSVAKDEARLSEEAHQILDFAGLSKRANEQANALPYGDQRLLEMAIALAARPKLLLLDEPVSGMNTAEKASFTSIIRKIRDLGITILLVEHDMRTVMEVSDRVICLAQGRIIADGPPTAIQQSDEVIKAYLGERFERAQA
ncbi:MAG: ABC transporter ATP-binding protein [Rhodomicrobium sp.]